MKQQSLLLINKQILELAMQQDDLNAVLGNMLSTAECLANRFGSNPKESFFDFYNLYGSGNTKNEEDLKTQLQIQTKVFRNNHNYMFRQTGNYPFPQNLGKKEIENLVKMWKENAKPENQMYFDNIIKILNKNYDLTFPKKKAISNGIDPEVTLELFPEVMKDVDGKRKIVRDEVSKSGVYNNNLKMKGKYQSNNIYNNKTNKMNNFDEEKKNFIQYLFNNFKTIEFYIYHTYYRSQKLSTNLKFGNKIEYDVIEPSKALTNLNQNLEELKTKYEEYSLYNDTSKDTEISKYKTTCKNWMKTFQNDYVIKKLGEILLSL